MNDIFQTLGTTGQVNRDSTGGSQVVCIGASINYKYKVVNYVQHPTSHAIRKIDVLLVKWYSRPVEEPFDEEKLAARLCY